MKTKISAIIALLVITISAYSQIDRSQQPKPGSAPAITLEVPGEFKLKNGLKVLVVENNKLPRVSYSLTIDNKPIIEGDKAGVLRLLSAMLGNGTHKISKDDFNEEIDFLGASLRFGSGSAYASCLSKYADRILELMSEATKHPLLTKEEFQKEKDKLIEGLKADEKSVDAIARRVGSALTYGKHHPFGEFVSTKTVENVTYEDVLAYYQKRFNPSNAYLTVIGDVDFSKLKRQVKNYFGDWEESISVETSIPQAIPNPKKTEIDFVDMPNAVQSNISLTHTVDLKKNNPDYFPVLIANTILGGGFNGYLNMNLREEHGYTYSSKSSIGSSRYISRFRAWASVRNEVTDSSVVEILNEIKRIKTETVTAETLNIAKQKYVGDFVLSLEKPSSVADYALTIILNNLPKDFYSNFLKKINAVTAEDVKRVANKYFKPENARIVVVGKGSDVIENLIKTGIPVAYYDTYANPVEKPNYKVELPSGVDAKSIINKYIEAIGGKTKIGSVTSIAMLAEGEIQPGVIMNLDLKKTSKNQLYQSLSFMGQSQKQVVNGKTGYISARGQKTDMTPDQVKKAQEEAAPFPETNYLNKAIKLEGIEDVDGEKAYKIKISNSLTSFYSVTSGLKIKEVRTEGPASSSFFYSDYKETKGIKFPSKIGQTMGPNRLDLTVTEMKVNEGVTDADFN